MAKKIRDTGRTQRRLRDRGATQRRVDPAAVAAALGAVDGGDALAQGNALSVAALCRLLGDRLQSTGGRPGLEGATRRQKIPLTDEQWAKLERLAAALTERGTTTTAGQVASVLLNQALTQVDEERLSEPA